jgi:hypothetical protein
MSQFGGNNWWQGLQGLFGGQQQAGGGASNTGMMSHGTGANTGYRLIPHPQQTWAGISQGPTGRADPFGGAPQFSTQYYERVDNRPGQGQAPTYGQTLAGALARDYQNAEGARQQELDMYRGLFGNIMNSMQGAGQMVQDARQSGQQNMQLMQQQAQQIRGAAGQGQQAIDEATRQMRAGLGEARTRFDQGIGTLQTARGTYDATNRSDTAAEVFGIQSQYKNQLDAISRRDDLTPEQKDMMTGELKQSMRQQSSALAAQADAKARDTLLALDQNISQMQATAAGQMGQFGIGVGQAIGQLGLQGASMRQQAEEQIGNFYNNMAQYNSSLLQSAQANALQYTLNGNQMAASLINAMPLGPMSIFETLARMVSAADVRRGQQVSPEMGNLFGRIG